MVANTILSENNSSETTYLPSAHGINAASESETRVVTQKEVYKQMRIYIAHLTR